MPGKREKRGSRRREYPSVVAVRKLKLAHEIIGKISDAIKALGGSDDELNRLVTDDDLAKRVAKVIMGSK